MMLARKKEVLHRIEQLKFTRVLRAIQGLQVVLVLLERSLTKSILLLLTGASDIDITPPTV
jgi:hypothetical protein